VQTSMRPIRQTMGFVGGEGTIEGEKEMAGSAHRRRRR